MSCQLDRRQKALYEWCEGVTTVKSDLQSKENFYNVSSSFRWICLQLVELIARKEGVGKFEV